MTLFSSDELNSFRQNIQSGKSYAQPTPTRKQPTGIKGFLARNAPTIGGVVGGVATAPLELLDAVSGVGGTALNVAGAAAGQSIGQKIKNELTGSKDSTAGAALAGAGGELGGRIIGKGVGKLVEKVISKPVAKGVAGIAEKNAATDVANEALPFASVAHGQDVQGALDLMKAHNMGTDPDSIKTAADLVTGQHGELNNSLRQILGGNGGKGIKVDVGDYLGHVKGAIDNEPLLGYADAKTGSGNKLLTGITKNKENNLFGGEGSLTQAADGNKVLDSIQYHQKQAARFKNAVPGTEGEAIGNVHKQAADYLEGKLTKQAGADKAVAEYKLEPNDAQSIYDNVIKKGGSPELANHIVNTINDAKSVGELRSAQAPFVRASQLADKAIQESKGSGYVKGAVAAAKPEGTGNEFSDLSSVYEAGSLLHGNPAAALPLVAKAGRSEPLVKGANAVVSKGRSANNSSTNILSKLTGGKLSNAPTVGQLVASTAGNAAGQSLNEGSPEQPGETPADKSGGELLGYDASFGADDGGSANGTTQDIENDGISKTDLVSMIASDPKNASTYLSLFNALKPKDTTTGTQQKAIAGAKQAQATLGTIDKSFSNAGGGHGRIGGVLANLSGKVGLNDSTKTYNDTAVPLAASLYKALGNTGTITDNDQKRIASLIPKTTDTKGEAQKKITQLQDLLAQAEQNVTAGV